MDCAMYINKKRLIECFCDLARIKSPSGEEGAIAVFLIDRLERLGLGVMADAYGNLIAKLSGVGEPIILCAHLDTVSIGEGKNINPIITGDRITSDGATILGADNKDSIAAILEAIILLKERNLINRPLEIIFTREEEAISRGAKNLDISLLSGKNCIISDSADPYGAIIRSAPYCYKFKVSIYGVRSHAKDPELGVNAIKIASSSLMQMPIGRVDDFTTVNVAYQVGGLREVVNHHHSLISDLSQQNRNTVPDLALIYGEVRGAKIENIKDVFEKIENIFKVQAANFGGSSEFEVQKLADGYFFEESDPLVEYLSGIFGQQGVRPNFVDSIGGSDANILNGRGICTVVVSSAHRNNHKISEYVLIEDLVRLTDLYLRIMTDNGQKM